MISLLSRRLGRALPSPYQVTLPNSRRFRELVLRVFSIELLAAAAKAVHPSDPKKLGRPLADFGNTICLKTDVCVALEGSGSGVLARQTLPAALKHCPNLRAQQMPEVPTKGRRLYREHS